MSKIDFAPTINYYCGPTKWLITKTLKTMS